MNITQSSGITYSVFIKVKKRAENTLVISVVKILMVTHYCKTNREDFIINYVFTVRLICTVPTTNFL